MPTVLSFLKRYWVVIPVLLGIYWLLYSCSKKSSKAEYEWQVVRKVHVGRSSLVLDVSATGEVKPQNRLEVKPPISGRVEEIFVKEGEQVKKGDLLAELSSTERAALLDAARSKADESYEYWKDVYRPTPLIAPIDGMVIVRSVEPGQTVDSGDEVVVISDRLIVDASVNETDVGYVKIGQPVTIVLDAYPEKLFVGTVDHIAYEATLEQNVNVYHVDILPSEIDPVFRSGMTAQVTIRAAEKNDVLTLPEETVVACPPDLSLKTGARCVALALKKGSPVWKEVEIGLTTGTEAEVISGLKEGDTVAHLMKRRVEDSTAKGGFGPFPRRRARQS